MTGQQVKTILEKMAALEVRVRELELAASPKKRVESTRENIIGKRTVKNKDHATGFRGVNCYTYSRLSEGETIEKTVFQARVRNEYISSFNTLDEAKEAVIKRCLELKIL